MNKKLFDIIIGNDSHIPWISAASEWMISTDEDYVDWSGHLASTHVVAETIQNSQYYQEQLHAKRN